MTPTEIITPRRILDSPSQHGKTFRHFVPESRFGIWFISSKIWSEHVLKVAIDDLAPLIPDRRRSYPTILDFGCGFGASFKMLQERFRPSRIIGVDCDPRMLSGTHLEARQQGLPIDVALVASEGIPLVDQSIDMIFCHQTFHHVIDQRGVLAEFRRVLKPGGLLLFAESTRTFIKSWIIRLLFRHPMDTQRDASEYLTMIGHAGFTVPPTSVSYPYLWWSRKGLGLKERVFGLPLPTDREETLINVVAVRD